ncbi:hypothetical protein BHM03_00009003 [Ensete ventricosum]|nr:hypothetical protein BHM03_00009003 [Ensete ventricosum]
MVQRLTYRKRHSYATKSNQTRVVKTPGKYPILASLICFRRRWEACLSVHEQEGEWAKMPCDWQEDSRSMFSAIHFVRFVISIVLLGKRFNLQEEDVLKYSYDNAFASTEGI